MMLRGQLISRLSAVTLKLLCKSITRTPAPRFEKQMAATDSKCYIHTKSIQHLVSFQGFRQNPPLSVDVRAGM